MHTIKAAAVARYLRTKAIAQDEPGAAIAFAHSQGWSDVSRIVAQIKAATPALGSSPSVVAPIALDFVDLVQPKTILGRLQGVRRMPFGSRMIGLSAATRAHWVKPGNAIPVSGSAFTAPNEIHRKAVAAIMVASDDLLRSADPQVEQALVADLVGATVAALDEAFIDVANAGTDATPTSITYGGPSTASTGSDLDAIRFDLKGLVATLVDGGANLMRASWVMHPRTATHLAALRGGACGAPAFPDIGVNGGTLLGLPAIVSASVPVTADTSAETTITLIDADGVLLVDDGEADISLAKHATLEMDSEPTGDATTPTAQSKHRVSLFQSDATAIKALRYLNWLPRRTTVAATLTGVDY